MSDWYKVTMTGEDYEEVGEEVTVVVWALDAEDAGHQAKQEQERTQFGDWDINVLSSVKVKLVEIE